MSNSNTGYITKPKNIAIHNVMVIDNRSYKIHTVVVHRFKLGDVEDPDLYAAEPLWHWQQSEMGQWIMSKAVDTPEWHRQMDPMQYHMQYAIVAKLKDIDYTFWQLKWGLTVDNK